MKKFLVTGLLVWVPLGITIWVLNLTITTMDQLVRYPHPDAWSLAFQTNVPNDVVSRFDEEYVAVFIPTTPSPVNGFYFFVRRADTIVLDMTVDVALRSIVSMGVVSDTPSAIPSSPTLS